MLIIIKLALACQVGTNEDPLPLSKQRRDTRCSGSSLGYKFCFCNFVCFVVLHGVPVGSLWCWELVVCGLHHPLLLTFGSVVHCWCYRGNRSFFFKACYNPRTASEVNACKFPHVSTRSGSKSSQRCDDLIHSQSKHPNLQHQHTQRCGPKQLAPSSWILDEADAAFQPRSRSSRSKHQMWHEWCSDWFVFL